jgi:UDP-N-acetylmuramoylalanine--D-glutamate ligase
MTGRGFDVTGRRVVVVGGARSGAAAASLLARRGARVTLTDVRPAIDESAALSAQGIALELGGHDPATFGAADLVVVSPGVKLDHPALEHARARGVPVVGELELAWRWIRGRVIAITGTKGKSTTTTLAGRMLEEAGLTVLVGGNIGVPLSSQVDRSTPDTLHVVEASSFQLEATDSFHPWIAALLNVSPDHLDQHASYEAYAAAKRRIFARQTASDWAVVNEDDEGARALAEGVAARRVPYGLDAPLREGVTVDGAQIVERRHGATVPLVPLSAVRVKGRHLLSDVVAAAAIGRTAGVPPAAMTRAVAAFAGIPHAMERLGAIDGVEFVNDSKATNVEAARRSIESVAADLVVVMGGRYKGGDFGTLAAPLMARGAAVVAIGEAAGLITGALGSAVRVERAQTMRDAVRTAFALAPAGGTVVLAPGCSSFDMFRDYAERGEAFRQEVQQLAAERRASREQ